MREPELRKWHRRLGIVLAALIVFQAGSGLLLTLSEWSEPHVHAHGENHEATYGHHGDGQSLWEESLKFIHHGAGTGGNIFRFVVGAGLLWMVVSGIMIFSRIRTRTKIKGVRSQHLTI